MSLTIISKGIINFNVKYITDEFGQRIADGYGGFLIDKDICKSIWSSTNNNNVANIAYRYSIGIIYTHTDFLMDEFGNYILDEFGNKIATKVIPGSIWSTKRDIISMGKIEFWGSYKNKYLFVTETSLVG